MAEHTEIMALLAKLEAIHRKKFTDVEKADILNVLRKSQSEDVAAATEPLKLGRFLPKYGEIIAAVDQAKTKRLGLDKVVDTYDAGPEPDDRNLALIRRHIGPVRFQSWFKGATVSIDDSAAVITVPGRAAVDWINKDLHVEVAAALKVNEAIAVLKGSNR